MAIESRAVMLRYDGTFFGLRLTCFRIPHTTPAIVGCFKVYPPRRFLEQNANRKVPWHEATV